MNPDDVNIDEVARLVLRELESDGAAGSGTPPDREPALRVIRDEVRGLVAALERDDSVPAPPDLVHRTAALLHERGLASVIAAVLVYDSRRRTQAGFRSSTARCHMTFDAEGRTIDLHFEPTGDRWRVRGQVGDDRSAPTGVVHFIATDRPEVVADAPIDSFGYFEAEAPRGQYDLELSTPDYTIVLERVQVG